MIDTQAIRSKILDLAMRGQLTEQLPEDGTAEELYQQILEEKQKLIKEGKIKKQKPLPEITDEEIPFEIPENWKWIRWGNVVNIVSARRVHQSDWRDSGVPFYRAREIAKLAEYGSVKNDLFISEELFAEFSKTGVPKENDLMVSAVGTLGKTYVVKASDRFYYKDASVLCFENYGKVDPYYLAYVMKSNNMRQQIKSNSGGTTVDTLTMVRMIKYLLPLPPLAEQKRIVEKVEQAFSILDTIDELQAQYADNLTALKSKLIDAAIQGKLTEHLPEDGTAEELYQQIQEEKQKLIKEGKIKKQKPLPEISDEEIPFDIPENWKWVRLSHITYSIFAGKDKPKDFVTLKDKKHPIPVVANAVTNDGIIGYTSIATANAGTLTVAGRGTIGFTCYRDYDYCPIVRLLVIDVADQIYPQYIKFVFQRLTVDSVGSSIPQLTVPMIRPKLIPLPPLAEQKRIVQKLDEILPLCEKLK